MSFMNVNMSYDGIFVSVLCLCNSVNLYYLPVIFCWNTVTVNCVEK